VDALELTRRLVRSQWDAVGKELKDLGKNLPSKEAIEDLLTMSEPIVGLLATAAIAEDTAIQQTIVEALTAARDYPVRCAMRVLRVAHARGSAAAALGLGTLHDDCARTLTSFVEAPVRAKDDWSIATPIRCGCALCKQLARFLVARNQRQLDWPLAKERRAHVHQIVERHELPVTHQTRRTGSPYTLVLCKTPALFARDAAERKVAAGDLAWLNKTARSFAPARQRPPQRSSRRA
jgi:hypothetical protein